MAVIVALLLAAVGAVIGFFVGCAIAINTPLPFWLAIVGAIGLPLVLRRRFG
jgi:hypothetical protein